MSALISPDWCRMMARYNAWQNTSLTEAAQGLDDAALRQDRGAFFGSILGTFNHLLWGDTIWMSRFGYCDPPGGEIAQTADYTSDLASFLPLRTQMDGRIRDWADALGQADLAGDESWYSGAMQRDVVKPRAVCVTHLFNHQTHHRGQIHAMLTAAGARPDDTDLVFMPEGT